MDKLIIFDFDGTIADTFSLAVKAYNAIAGRYWCKEIRQEHIKSFRELGFMGALTGSREFGLAFWKIPFVVRAVQREMRDGLVDARPFPGIKEALCQLAGQGVRLGIITSNSKENVDQYLRLHGLSEYFLFVLPQDKVFQKDKIIRRAAKRYGKGSDIFYVGDEGRDIEAARRAKVKSVAVTWGFELGSALEKLKPDYVVNHAAELLVLNE